MAKKKEQQRASRQEEADEARQQATARRGKRGKTSTSLLVFGGVAVVGALAVLLAPPRQIEVRPVPRVPVSEMTVARFLQEFSAQKPVVITGAWAESGWRPEQLAAACPHAVIRTFRHEEGSKTWASHVQAGNMSMPEYVQQFFVAEPPDRPSTLLYGFEMELKKHCPAQLDKVIIPSFLTQDAFHMVTNKTGLGWPSVLLGPQGSKTGLHIDTHRLPFWIATVSREGRSGRPLKRFRVFPHKDPNVLRYGRPMESVNFVFDFDPWEPNYRLYPKLAEGHVFETLMESGDLLYIPGGSPHAVVNMDDNLAVSMNFLDLKTMPDFARKCNKGSPLCGLLAGAGEWLLGALEERTNLPKDMSYFEFAGLADAAEFCTANAADLRGEERFPALDEFCAQRPADAS